MTTIRLKENEPVEVALRRFRREIERTGLIKELRARTAYEKPTTERKRKKAAAVSRTRKTPAFANAAEEALLRSRDCFGSTNRVLPLAV